MVAAFAFVIVALLIKDTAPIGDVYVLRSLSQGIGLAAGFWWIFTQSSLEAIKRYWLVLVYSGILCATAFISTDAVRVLLQVLSLIAVTLFFVSFCERARQTPTLHTTAARVVIYALLPICIGSLLLYKISPTLAYDQTVERLAWENAHRFKGLFGKPAGIAAASGIFLYIRRKGLLVAIGVGGLLTALVLFTVLNVNTSTLNQSKAMRSDSLENLSGRTTLWALAMTRFWDRPLLGYGYTVGHTAFLYNRHAKAGDVSGNNVDLFRNETFSLHNGYVQALLDSGALGALAYLIIMGLTIWRIARLDDAKAHASALYTLIFLSIANIGETLVYTPATFHATYYWYAAILALGLRPSVAPGLEPPLTTDLRAEPVRTSRYPILSYPTT